MKDMTHYTWPIKFMLPCIIGICIGAAIVHTVGGLKTAASPYQIISTGNNIFRFNKQTGETLIAKRYYINSSRILIDNYYWDEVYNSYAEVSAGYEEILRDLRDTEERFQSKSEDWSKYMVADKPKEGNTDLSQGAQTDDKDVDWSQYAVVEPMKKTTDSAQGAQTNKKDIDSED